MDYDYLDIIYRASSETPFDLFLKMYEEIKDDIPEPVNFLLERYSCVKDDHALIFGEKEKYFWTDLFQMNFRLPFETIRKYRDSKFMSWYHVSLYQDLSNDEIDEFIDMIDWTARCAQVEIDEESIRKYCDRIRWTPLCCRSDLSESLMREFKDRISWTMVSRCQKMSFEFMTEFWNRIDCVELESNKNADKSDVAKFFLFLKDKIYNRKKHVKRCGKRKRRQ